MSFARLHLPKRLTVCAAWIACAVIQPGCKPVQVLQPVATQPPNGFTAPPVPGGQGVMVDPFAMDSAGPMTGAAPLAGGAPGASQIRVPVANPDWTWEQIVDTVDDYFRIERERQVQLVGDVLTEGRIDGFPRIGATVAEPHRRDSVGRYNRWESTFQTIRRRATVRVIPDAAGYVVDVTVEKDLEDLPRPEFSTAGVATFRNDSSLGSAATEQVSRTQLAGRWIYIGRDPALEQQMLAEIQSRLTVQPAAYTGP